MSDQLRNALALAMLYIVTLVETGWRYTWQERASIFWQSRLGQHICERRGHPGVHWYNGWGGEPDMHCVRCGRDMG